MHPAEKLLARPVYDLDELKVWSTDSSLIHFHHFQFEFFDFDSQFWLCKGKGRRQKYWLSTVAGNAPHLATGFEAPVSTISSKAHVSTESNGPVFAETPLQSILFLRKSANWSRPACLFPLDSAGLHFSCPPAPAALLFFSSWLLPLVIQISQPSCNSGA